MKDAQITLYATSFEDLREEGDEPESTNYGYGADTYDYGSGAMTKYVRAPWYKGDFDNAAGGAVFDNARTGNVSLKLSRTAAGGNPYYAYRIDDVTAGQRFTASVWIRGEDGSDGINGGYVEITFCDKDGKPISGGARGPALGSKEWAECLAGAAAPGGAAYAEVRLCLKGTAAVYFDDLAVTADPPPAKAEINGPAGETAFSGQAAVREGEEFELSLLANGGEAGGELSLRIDWQYDVPQIIWAQAAPGFVLDSAVHSEELTAEAANQRVALKATAPRSAEKATVSIQSTGTAAFCDARFIRTRERYSGDAVSLKLTGTVLTDHFYGFGSHGDYRLACPINTDHKKYPWLNGDGDWDQERDCGTGEWANIGSDGKYAITEKDVKLWRDKTMAMRPQIMRLFFAYQWWCDAKAVGIVEYFDSPEKYTPELKDMIDWIKLLKEAGCDVLMVPWGDSWAYPALWKDELRPVNVRTKQATLDMQRLPKPEFREDMVAALVAFLDYLINGLGLTNVKYVTLMNEPDCFHVYDYLEDDFAFIDAVWDVSNRLTDEIRKNPGTENLHVVGVDHATRQAQGGNKQPDGAPKIALEMLTHMADRGLSWADSVAVHTYMNRNTALLKNFLGFDVGYLKCKGYDKPIWIPEFGYGELTTYTLSEIDKYYYGMWMMDFAISAIKNGAAALLNFYFGDLYLSETGLRQNTGLWKTQRDGWVNKPAYYAWSLINRHTKAGSKALSVDIGSGAEWFLDSVALEAPGGELAILAINKSYQPVELTIDPGLAREAVFDVYIYTAEAVPRNVNTPDLIRTSGTLAATGGETVKCAVPSRSFIILTEID